MSKAKTGDAVAVHYTGKLDDGSVFDSSKERDPLSFKIGAGQMIPGFEKAVVGLAVGENTTITIPPEEAYGEPDKDRVLKVPKKDVPSDIPTAIGTELTINQPDGQQIPAIVTDADEESIVLDANHPLAGKTLTFEIEMVSIS